MEVDSQQGGVGCHGLDVGASLSHPFSRLCGGVSTDGLLLPPPAFFFPFLGVDIVGIYREGTLLRYPPPLPLAPGEKEFCSQSTNPLDPPQRRVGL